MTAATKPARLADAIRDAIPLMEADNERHRQSALGYACTFPNTAAAAAAAHDARVPVIETLRAALPQAEAVDALARNLERMLEHADRACGSCDRSTHEQARAALSAFRQVKP